MIDLDQGVMIPGRPDTAFEPPVGRVKAVSKMGPQMGETGCLQQADDPLFMIYPDVPLVDLVLFVGQHPADAFRYVARNGEGQVFPRLEDSC
jgi:hypothetical protein